MCCIASAYSLNVTQKETSETTCSRMFGEIEAQTRYGASTSWLNTSDNTLMYLFGGCGSTDVKELLNDVHVFNVKARTWSKLSPQGKHLVFMFTIVAYHCRHISKSTIKPHSNSHQEQDLYIWGDGCEQVQRYAHVAHSQEIQPTGRLVRTKVINALFWHSAWTKRMQQVPPLPLQEHDHIYDICVAAHWHNSVWNNDSAFACDNFCIVLPVFVVNDSMALFQQLQVTLVTICKQSAQS